MKKTFGQSLQEHRQKALNSPEIYEAGEVGAEMGKSYMKDLLSMIEKHKNLSGKFYIFIAYENNFLTPETQKIVMCSMREPPAPFPGTDVWSYDNERGDLVLHWTLPTPETWDSLKDFVTTDKSLLKYMSDFEDGKLDIEHKKLMEEYGKSPAGLAKNQRAV